MNCEEARVLLHALIDGELDAGHAREVEAHVAGCPRCAAELRDSGRCARRWPRPTLRYDAPASLRRASRRRCRPPRRQRRRAAASLLKGFALGTALSAAVAASALVFVVRTDEEQRILGDVVSAHLRSLQADHLTDVQSTDQHTVKPWFNGGSTSRRRSIDLTAQGFTLLGGRLDYIDGAPSPRSSIGAACTSSICSSPSRQAWRRDRRKVQGFNVRRWTWSDLDFWAISDIAADELQEFDEKFQTVLRTSGS